MKAVLSGLSSATMRKAPIAYGWTAKHGIPDDITEQWVTPALTDANVRRDIAKVAKGIDPAITLDAATRVLTVLRTPRSSDRVVARFELEE